MDGFPLQIVDEVAHRPWPLPAAPWVMTQSWHDVLFAHWPVAPEVLRARLPPGLALDLFAGEAWVGVVPFHMTNVAPRFAPAVPGLSAFPEVNVRTYVTAGGRPGVYFFSLDAESRVAVGLARAMLRLPYYVASMDVTHDGDWVDYWSERHADEGAPPAEFEARYRPTGPAVAPRAGTLEHFLVERYCLFQVDERRAYRLDIHHPPWPLQPAEAVVTTNTLVDAAGVTLPPRPPVLHYARRQDMVAWLPEDL